MLLFLLVGLLLIATAVTMLSRAVAVPRNRAMRNLEQIQSYGFTPTVTGDDDGDSSALRALLDDLAALVGEVLGDRMGSVKEAELRKQLVAAGLYTMPPKRFLGYQAMSGITFPLALAWLCAAVGVHTILLVFVIVIAAPVGWGLPRMLARRRAERRAQEIDYELPELIDLLVVTVEAGLGFTGSMRMAATRLDGALGAELRLMLQEQTMGLSSTEALRNFLDRCDTPAVRSFVRSILQGEKLGVSIGQIMRNLATEMRKRRRQAAEERAHKAPVKMLFPLVFMIFPALFVVILGPALFALQKAFE